MWVSCILFLFRFFFFLLYCLLYLFCLFLFYLFLWFFLVFFFFQAEDGIRDADVLEFRRVLFRSSFSASSFNFSWFCCASFKLAPRPLTAATAFKRGEILGKGILLTGAMAVGPLQPVPIRTVGSPTVMEPPWAVMLPTVAAGLPPIKTVASP